MTETFTYFSQLPLVELIAVFMALMYVILAAKGNIWCWPAAFISTILYTAIFYDVYLLMDSLLQVYYMVMAVYGWYCWQQANNSNKANKVLQIDNDTNASSQKNLNDKNKTPNNTIIIETWALQTHVYIIVLLSVTSLLLGWLMANYTQADFPYFDAATTVFAVFATFMVTKKILENWLYWVVIDFVSIYIYIEKGLTPTAVLFGLYVVLATYGYFQWRKNYQQQQLPLCQQGQDTA